MKRASTVIKGLEKLGIEFARDINEFYGTTGKVGVWFSGEDYIDDLAIYNPYWFDEDPNEQIWVRGVLKVVDDYIDSCGYYVEPYDNGTLMAYPK